MIKLENKNLRPRDPDNLPDGCWYVEEFDEYLWTWEAGMKEAEAQGKRLPTDEELEEIFKDKKIKHNKVKRSIECAGYEFPLAGYHTTDTITLYTRGYLTHLWSSTTGGYGAYGRYLYYDNSTVYQYSRSTTDGFSARCIED